MRQMKLAERPSQTMGVYRERMIEAQKKHLPTFQATMRGE